MKKKGVCFGCSAGSTVRNSSTIPMKRGASSVRRLPHRAMRRREAVRLVEGREDGMLVHDGILVRRTQRRLGSMRLASHACGQTFFDVRNACQEHRLFAVPGVAAENVLVPMIGTGAMLHDVTDRIHLAHRDFRADPLPLPLEIRNPLRLRAAANDVWRRRDAHAGAFPSWGPVSSS